MKNIKNINIGQFTDSYQVPSVMSKQEAWELLEKKINSGIAPEMKRKTITLNWKVISLASAAAVIGFIVWFGLNTEQKFSPTINTSVAKNQTVWLPDSSKVQLNSNSSISYLYNKINGDRNVLVKGDALFDVEKGKKFVVNFEGGEVKVTGTSFYVSAYSPDLLQVDCVEGSVEVLLANQTFSLRKGNGIRMYNGKISGQFVCEKGEVTERLNGIFYWKRISLPEIADLIGYRFGYNAIIDPSLNNRNFSGKLDLNKLEQGLLVISMAMDVEYFIDEDQKTIFLDAK